MKDIEGATMYSGSQASQPEDEEALLDTQEPDLGAEIEEYLALVYIEHGEEFTEQAENQHDEEALARAVRESTEFARRAYRPYREGESSAAGASAGGSSIAIALQRKRQPTRKGKERMDYPE